MPLSFGTWSKKRSRASSPPADAPIPTTKVGRAAGGSGEMRSVMLSVEFDMGA